MKIKMKIFCAALALAATMAIVPAASAQVVHIVAAGSSAQFQPYAIAAVNDLTPLTGDPYTQVHHWSVKTSNAASNGCGATCAGIVDNRTAGIPEEFGNLWVVWTCDQAPPAACTVDHLWAYISVDSTVGVRTFLAGDKLVLSANIGSTTAGNAISSALFLGGAGNNGAAATCASGDPTGTCDDTNLPANVIALLGGSGSGAVGYQITAGATDIRAEDAKLATNRSLGGPLDTVQSPCTAVPCRSFALNYGNGTASGGNVAKTQFLSGEDGGSPAAATPVQFGLPGYPDPITGVTVSNTIVTIPLGESPVVFLVNRSNPNGVGLNGTATSGGGHGDGSYWIRNVWDQHPCATQGTSPLPVCNSGAIPPSQVTVGHDAPGPRRPLGNLFTGHDCAIDNAAFDWPGDGGLRIIVPGNPSTVPGINLILREALSGTMNTTEFTEFRRFGTENGNGAPANGQPALTSQEENINPATESPAGELAAAPCSSVSTPSNVGGTRTRAIGTGEVVNGGSASGTGILGLADSLGYAFFSFGNVSKIASKSSGGVLTPQPNYGYLMVDGIDPLFDSYSNSGVGNPGQPAILGTPTSWGELPGCSEQSGSALPHCTTAAIWSGNSFPNIRNGSYQAWSELRLLCDSNNAHCLESSDTMGAQALVWNTQCDIHFNHLGGVPDFLPFNDPSSSSACTWNAPYGDAGFVREHYTYLASIPHVANAAYPTPTNLHESPVVVDYGLEACSTAIGPSTAGNPVTGPAPINECGGDAGGLLVPVGTTSTGVQQ
jgi:hypothetical protein